MEPLKYEPSFVSNIDPLDNQGLKPPKKVSKIKEVDPKYKDFDFDSKAAKSYNLNSEAKISDRSREITSVYRPESGLVHKNSDRPEPVLPNALFSANSPVPTDLISPKSEASQKILPPKKDYKVPLIILGVLVGVLTLIVIALVVLVIIFGLKVNTDETKTTTKPTLLPDETTSTTSTTSTPFPFYTLPICRQGFTGPNCSDECGGWTANPNVKIVGGVEAKPNSWPSMAYLEFNYKFDYIVDGETFNQTYSSSCGGSLITRMAVLTAAHCLPQSVDYSHNETNYTMIVRTNNYHPTIESMFKIYLGMHNVSEIEEQNSSLIQKSVIAFIKHYDYDPVTNLNDIAIIILDSSVVLNAYIKLACLPPKTWVPYPYHYYIDAWAAGWGRESEGATEAASHLNNVRLTLYPNQECKNVSYELTKSWDRQMCAGEINGGKDTCQGDSGGPLFIKDYVNGQLKFVLAGVTSYGDGCGDSPGIYARVSYFIPWIEYFIYF